MTTSWGIRALHSGSLCQPCQDAQGLKHDGWKTISPVPCQNRKDKQYKQPTSERQNQSRDPGLLYQTISQCPPARVSQVPKVKIRSKSLTHLCDQGWWEGNLLRGYFQILNSKLSTGFPVSASPSPTNHSQSQNENASKVSQGLCLKRDLLLDLPVMPSGSRASKHLPF